MNTGKKLWKIVALVLLLVSVPGANWVLAHDDDNDRRMISIPLSSAGLVFGEGLRTTLFNRGPHRINLQTSVIDADGSEVKQEPLVLEPGQMRTLEMSRSEVLRDERSVIVRTEVSARRGDARNLWMTSEVIDWSTGSTRFQAGGGGGCDEFGCGTNHNETLVRDTEPMK